MPLLSGWNSKFKAQLGSNVSKSSVNVVETPEGPRYPVYHDAASPGQRTTSELNLDQQHKLHRLKSKTSQLGRGIKPASNASVDSFYTAVIPGQDTAETFAERAWQEDLGFIEREELVGWLGSPSEIRRQALVHYMAHFDFRGTVIDEAIRLLCNKLYIKGETQQIDRILEAFSEHYISQNPKSIWEHADIVDLISCAVILLNADLQAPGLKTHITSSQFVCNTIEAVRTQLHQEGAVNRESGIDPTSSEARNHCLALSGLEEREISRELATIYHHVRARPILQMRQDDPAMSPLSKAGSSLLKWGSAKLYNSLRGESPYAQSSTPAPGVSFVSALGHRISRSMSSSPSFLGITSNPSIHSSDGVNSRQMTSQEMFQCLVDHGCIDLSSDMDPEQYSLGLIHGGGFGDIWKGKFRNGTEVAIKVWRFNSIPHNGSKSMKRAMREIYYWSKAKHPNIQELMGVIMFQERLGMVSLWMEHGNLREYIDKYPNVDRYPLCTQVVRGVWYLHILRMVHGDIKAANILVSRDGVAKLSDFDHSIMAECSLAFSETSKPGGGTTRWMAPELILDDECHRNEHTDIYALGMTMLEIITGNSPYHPECREDHHVIKAVMQKRLPKRQTTHFDNNPCDNQMWELLLRCWDRKYAARPKAFKVLELLNDVVGYRASYNQPRRESID